MYTNGRVLPQGSPGQVLDAAQRLVQERVPPDPVPKPSHSFDMIGDEYKERARSALEQLGASTEAPHANETWRRQFRRGRSKATIVLYSTGKCVLQGADPAWQLAFDVLNSALAAIGGVPAPREEQPEASRAQYDATQDHIGTDEAGKGDYFGPLVCAAVCVDEQLSQQLRDLGVRDSKTLADGRVRQLAERVRLIAEGKYAVTAVNPPKYNVLYDQFKKEKKNLNSLLAWGHARSIERLLNSPVSRGIKPSFVLVDQFAHARHVEDRTRRVNVPVFQHPKAESDIAVAAASILARDAFLAWLEKWSVKIGMPLPKGASAQVIAAGKAIVRRWGKAALTDIAKVSFRTTEQVLQGEDEDATRPAPPWNADAEPARES